jgi:hypothetical protein
MSVTCASCCHRIFNIITRPEHISRSTRIARKPVQYIRLPRARSLPSRRSVVYIITTNDVLRELRRSSKDACFRMNTRSSPTALLIAVIVADHRGPASGPPCVKVVHLSVLEQVCRPWRTCGGSGCCGRSIHWLAASANSAPPPAITADQGLDQRGTRSKRQ